MGMRLMSLHKLFSIDCNQPNLTKFSNTLEVATAYFTLDNRTDLENTIIHTLKQRPHKLDQSVEKQCSAGTAYKVCSII